MVGNINMDILIIILVIAVVLGLLLLLFFFLDGLIMVEPLEKLEYIAQMGVVLAPCVVMSTDEFGEPYTLQTWAITFGLMLGCLLLSIILNIGIEWIEERANKRQIKKQKKNKQKAVKNLLGRSAVKKYKNSLYVKKVEDVNINLEPKEKEKISVSIAKRLATAKGSTLAAATAAPILIVLNGGLDKLIDPLCILTVLLGIGLSLLCGWISNEILLRNLPINEKLD